MTARGPSDRSPLRFFALVFVLSVPFWFVGALGWPEWAETRIVDLPVSSLMVGCPVLAAAVLVYREDGLRGVRQLVAGAFRRPAVRPGIWYIPVLLLMPAILVLSYAAMRILGLPLPDPHLSLPAVLLMFVVFFASAVIEELGWMGYAAGPLLARYSALTASIILGVVWALWHVVPDLQAGRTASWVTYQFLFTVVARVLIVWLYTNAGRSVLATVLFHDMINVSVFSFPNYGSHYNPAVTTAVTLAVAIVVTLLWGPTTLARYRYGPRSAEQGRQSADRGRRTTPHESTASAGRTGDGDAGRA